MSFDSLGLRPELLRAVREQDYTIPTAVQIQAIPAVLAGRDLMAAAQTGSGKTAGFTLPMLQLLMNEHRADAPGTPRRVRALVLVPTRELCAQVNESVCTYGEHLPLRSVQIFGGVGMQPQVDALRRGVDIVIATPGRLLDHVERRTLDLRYVEILVLDEADRMLDMGFIHAIKRILNLLPKARQNLLFSATFADDIRALADKLLNAPQMIEVTPRNRPVDSIEQQVFQVDGASKTDLLAHLVVSRAWSQVLVFTRTKHGANRLADKLLKVGISADAIHGNKSQNARTRALESFKAQKIRVLVATDIAARGIDIDGLPQVVNFEMPQVPEDYVHRIGRTGRAGADGCAVSLVSRDEYQQWRAIERLIKRTIVPTPLPAFATLVHAPDTRPPLGAQGRRGPSSRQSSGADRSESGRGASSRSEHGRSGSRSQGAGQSRSAALTRTDAPRASVSDGPRNEPAARPRPQSRVASQPQSSSQGQASAQPQVRFDSSTRRPAEARSHGNGAPERRTDNAAPERKRYFNGQVVDSGPRSRGQR